MIKRITDTISGPLYPVLRLNLRRSQRCAAYSSG